MTLPAPAVASEEGRRREEAELRLKVISEAIFQVASQRFREALPLKMDGSVEDAIAGGVNMLAEELQAQFDERGLAARELEQKVRQRTAELEASQERLAQYRTLFEMSRTLALVMDLDGSILHASLGWAHLMGQSEHALLRHKIWTFFHPDDEGNPTQRELSVELGWIAKLDLSESHWRASDGSYRELAWHASFDAERRVACAVAHDVTQLRSSQRKAEEARAQAVAASQVKSRFLANMSHEIRTPMSNVLGMTALALEEGLTGRQREYVEAAHLSAQSLLAIVNDILDISKIEAGKLAIASLPFSPRQEVEAALTPLFLRARDKKLTTELAIDARVPDFLLGDAVRFRQVLVNLVFNAVKFTDKGSISVRVGMEEDGERIHVVVEDSGVGVAREHIGTIFEPFRQGDESTGRTFGGTGLGLPICKELTTRMGGAIWVESEPGKGSAFHFTARLPRASAAVPERDRASTTLRAPSAETAARKLHVLVAEDNELSAKLVVRLLERSNCETVWVSGGRLAVEAAASRAFDLILMDMQMPGMDGLEATANIRRRESTAQAGHVPIWALTANAMKGDDLLCIQAGMDGHLAKPIDRARLSSLLSRVRLNVAAAEGRSDASRSSAAR